MPTLRAIAAEMETEAKRRGSSTWTLARGLELRLSWVAGMKVLVLTRPDTGPGKQEVMICRDAFGVPAEAQQLNGVTTVHLRWPSE